MPGEKDTFGARGDAWSWRDLAPALHWKQPPDLGCAGEGTSWWSGGSHLPCVSYRGQLWPHVWRCVVPTPWRVVRVVRVVAHLLRSVARLLAETYV